MLGSMDIRYVPISEILPYPNNPRHVPAGAVQQVAASISEYGWQQPIVLDTEGVIIAGHTRYAAAQSLELETIPCYVAEHLTPQQAAAYRLADNRTGEITGWDLSLLTAEIDALAEAAIDTDLSIPGFDTRELAAMFELAKPAAPAAPPQPPAPRELRAAPDTGRLSAENSPPDAEYQAAETTAENSHQAPAAARYDWYLDNSLVYRAMIAGVK